MVAPRVSDVVKAIEGCRAVVREFVAAKLDYATFRERMALVMGPLDPLDWAMKTLTTTQQAEATFYVEWLGGEFGETEHQIPRRADWVYGESDEPYGWVDQEEYRRRLGTAFIAVTDTDA